MPNPLVAVAGISAGSGLIGASKQASAAKSAASAQTRAAEAGIEEQRRQFDKVRELLAPFVAGGTEAFQGALALGGALGAEKEAEAIQAVQQSPQYTEALRQGENAILSTASATGGLRGGNTQGALAQFAPSLLNQTIAQRYAQLGGLGQIGQASAAGVGSAAQLTGQNVANLQQQIGAAQAGGALAQGQAWQTGLSGITKGAGFLFGNMDMTIPKNETAFSSWGF